MQNCNELKLLIQNVSVSDDEIILHLKRVLSERFDAEGNIIMPNEEEISCLKEVRQLLERGRAEVVRELRAHLLGKVKWKDLWCLKKLF